MRQIKSLLSRLRSLLGVLSLASAILAVLSLVAAGLLYLLLPDLRSSALSLAGLGLLFLLLFLLGAFQEVKTALLGRRGRYGVNTGVMLGAFLGIAILVNFLGWRNHTRLDVTATQVFTLSPQTVKVLQDLKQPVEAVGFFLPQPRAEHLLKEYSFKTDKFSYSFVDPDAQPAIARQYEIRDYGVVVFQSEGHRQQVGPTDISEQTLTSAILKVTGKEQKKVYFLTGHNEPDPEVEDAEGYSYAKQGLIWDNYLVLSLSLATQAQVPQEAAVVVIAGPKRPFLEQEVQALEAYLRQGGKLLALADPNHSPELDTLLAKWGISVGKNLVVDPTSAAFPDVGTPVIQRRQYLGQQITRALDTTFFPEAAAVHLDPKVDDSPTMAGTFLFGTTPDSWEEKNPQEVRFDEGTDQKGPLFLGLAMLALGPLGEQLTEPPEKVARLIVIGDSDFASNRFFYSLGNGDLFLNSVNWLAEEEELISIRPKPLPFRLLVVTSQEWQWILYSSLAFLPLAVVLVGGWAWWRRR